MPTVPTSIVRSVHAQAQLGGRTLNDLVSATCTFGFDESVSSARITLRTNPGFGGYNDSVVLSMGAGNNNVVRFTGLRRDPGFDLAGGYVIEARGPLTLAAEYTNTEDPSLIGGLTIADLVGSPTSNGAPIIQAVLSKVGVGFNSISDNGVIFNTQGFDEEFIWSAGTDPQGLSDLQQPGQSALDYINEYCKVMAVYTSDSAPVGFYRIFETIGGVYCVLIGGRPRSSPDHVYTEGRDIISGTTRRSYPKGNSVLVTGYDFGDGGPDGNGGPEYFVVQSSNDVQGSRRVDAPPFHSRMIERSLDVDPGGGMSCQTVANALLADYNRETVSVQCRVFADDVIGPGQTILIQGPGGQPGNLGVGEKLWVRGLTVGFDANSDPAFYQDLDLLGGGPASDRTPGVPV